MCVAQSNTTLQSEDNPMADTAIDAACAPVAYSRVNTDVIRPTVQNPAI